MPVAEFSTEIFPESRILVEVDEPEEGLVRVAQGEGGLLKATETLESAIGRLKPVAKAVLATVAELAPDEAEVELGLKLTAESGVILAKAGGEAHLHVKLTWKRDSKS